MRTISWQLMSGAGVQKLSVITDQQLRELDLVTDLKGSEALSSVDTPAERRLQGDRILDLYFRQWLVPEGLFLDLRSARFGLWEDGLGYCPNGLWVQLRPDFREGMLALYRSFYDDDNVSFELALRRMGMIHPDLSSSAQTELKELLHAHFGINQQRQKFSIDAFKTSFDQLFSFFISHNYRLHSDFVLVGFYLITLYLNLEELGQAHDVRGLCASALLD